MNNDSLKNQDIFLHNRSDLTISNVKKINTLNSLLFDIETGYGKVKIEGINLGMLSLDNEKGILVLRGTIDKIEFLDKTKQKKETSFISKIFK